MSVPSDRQRRAPLHERSQSQNNTLAIRIVPYTPPRLQAQHGSTSGSAHDAAATQPYATEGSTVPGDDGDGGSMRSSIIHQTKSLGKGKEDYAGGQGSALPSASSSTISLARRRDDGVSGPKLATGTSHEGPRTPTSAPVLRSPPPYVTNISSVNAPTQPATDQPSGQDGDELPASPSSALSVPASIPRPLSRRRNIVAVHSDKTFSLIPQAPSSTREYGGFRSPPLSLSATSGTTSSLEGRFSDVFSGDDRPSSPLTSSATIPESLYSLNTSSPGSSTIQLIEDHITTSPWNYRLVGGLRKVPKTPDLKQKKAVYPSSSSPEATPLPVLPEISTSSVAGGSPESQRSLIPKASFNSEQSEQSASTTSETTNYKVYGHSPSPAQDSTDSLRPSSSHSDINVQVLGVSSPAAPFDSSPPGTLRSDQNYVLHGGPSPASSLVTVSRRPRPTYSQESLRVPPLQPHRRGSQERLGYYKQRSRESLRHRAGSIKSLKSIKSISSLISEGTVASFYAGQSFLNLPNPPFPVHVTPSPNPSGRHQEVSWAASPSSDSPSHLSPNRVPMLPSTPHQWSSQLSTVMSESEVGSSRGGSRSVSGVSGPPGTGSGAGRRSSRGWASSTHSRQMLSISSSLAAELEQSGHSRSNSRSDSVVERPQASYARNGQGGPSMRMVRDQDEHGDGLADLHEINQRPSRSGLSGFFSSSNSSERNLHSSASSRSLNSVSIPAWAKLYYGSGERRYLGGRSESILSDSTGSRPGSVFRDGSPAADHFPLNINSPRKRAREVQPSGRRPYPDQADMDIAGYQPMDGGYQIRPRIRKMTSSIWSPHLRTDRRADRYSMWEPPSVNWSAESGMLGRRNIQVVMFITGFIFPFAWMVAAFLPLPPRVQLQMLERDHSQSHFGSPDEYMHEPRPTDDLKYQSARWWRNLNRGMSIVGVLIIAAIVALVVVSVRQGWST